MEITKYLKANAKPTTPLLAFINSELSKEQAVERAKQYEIADQYEQGTYGCTSARGTPRFKGCSVGCMAQGCHSDYEELFGICIETAWWSDVTFEHLESVSSSRMTYQLFENIKKGSNTRQIYHKFATWFFSEKVPILNLCTMSENMRLYFIKLHTLLQTYLVVDVDLPSMINDHNLNSSDLPLQWLLDERSIAGLQVQEVMLVVIHKHICDESITERGEIDQYRMETRKNETWAEMFGQMLWFFKNEEINPDILGVN